MKQVNSFNGHKLMSLSWYTCRLATIHVFTCLLLSEPSTACENTEGHNQYQYQAIQTQMTCKDEKQDLKRLLTESASGLAELAIRSQVG